MSDSFADLWNASAPLPAKSKPQKLSAAAAAGGIQRTTSKKADSFSLLATPLSNSNTGNSLSSSTYSRPITPSRQSTTKKDTGGDAFADLFSGSTTTTKSGHAGMTLAARLAM